MGVHNSKSVTEQEDRIDYELGHKTNERFSSRYSGSSYVKETTYQYSSSSIDVIRPQKGISHVKYHCHECGCNVDVSILSESAVFKEVLKRLAAILIFILIMFGSFKIEILFAGQNGNGPNALSFVLVILCMILTCYNGTRIWNFEEFKIKRDIDKPWLVILDYFFDISSYQGHVIIERHSKSQTEIIYRL